MTINKVHIFSQKEKQQRRYVRHSMNPATLDQLLLMTVAALLTRQVYITAPQDFCWYCIIPMHAIILRGHAQPTLQTNTG